FSRDWSSDVCSSDLPCAGTASRRRGRAARGRRRSRPGGCDRCASRRPGGPRWGWARTSDLEQLALLAGEQGVDRVDVPLRERLELLLGAVDLVLARLAVLDELLERLLRVTAHRADRDARVLGLLLRELDVVAPALLGQGRQDAADDVAVVRGVDAEVAVPQGLLDVRHDALVEG